MANIRDPIREPIRDPIRDPIATTVPAKLANALIWFDETTVQQSAGSLTSWGNKGIGGASYDLDTITGTISITIVAGKDVLSFPGTAYVRPTALAALTEPSRVYVSYQLTDLTTQIICRVYDSHNSGTFRNHLGLDKTNDFHWIEAGTVLATPNTSLTANVEVVSSLFNGGSSELEVSGLTKVTGSAGSQTWNFCTLGANFAGTVGQMMLGTIHEFIVFNGGTLPDATEDTQIFNYLRNRWGSL